MADGQVEVHVGKVELGQGILTALAQIAADALALPFDPDPDGDRPHHPRPRPGAHRRAACRCSSPRRRCGTSAPWCARWPARPTRGDVRRPDRRPRPRHRPARGRPGRRRRPPSVVGRSDAAARPARQGARPTALPRRPAARGPAPRPGAPAAVARAPCWLARRGLEGTRCRARPRRLVRRGRRRAGGRRRPGARAARARRPRGPRPTPLPDEDDLVGLAAQPGRTRRSRSSTRAPLPEPTLSASYSKPFLVHGSIAPSVGDGPVGRRPPAGVEPQPGHPRAARRASPGRCGTPRRVEVEHVENAGCYGHNAADDAAFDAVLLARAVPGRPVQARWTRPDELTWGPLSSAMTATALGVAGGRPGRRLEPRRLEPGPQLAARLPRHARPAGRRPPGEADAAAARHDPPPRPPAAGPPATRCPATTSARAGWPGTAARLPAAHLGDAGARGLPQRVRDRELHGRAGPRGRRGPGGLPARPPRRPARACTWSRRPAGSPAGVRPAARRRGPRPGLRPLQGQGRPLRGGRRGGRATARCACAG